MQNNQEVKYDKDLALKAADLYTRLRDGLAIIVDTKQASFVSKRSAETFQKEFPGWTVEYLKS